ncbi:MAG: tetratricopeptide repeat protein [Prevotellaceae bacterium]|jgi:clan AA aspartic protease (TIGR02281 family)|nr:tetratricopeptide repeat protein [Prevotellaceae bacterium]
MCNKIYCILVGLLICATGLFAQTDIDRGLRALKNDDYVTALKCFNEALKEHPDDVDALYLRAATYMEMEEYNKALSDYNAAIKNYKKSEVLMLDDLLFKRGELYYIIENNEKAIVDFSAAIKYNPKNKYAYLSRAKVYSDEKNYSAATADYKQTLSIDETITGAKIGLARNLIEQGQNDEAIEMLTQAAKVDPQYGSIYGYRALAYDQKGDYRHAIDDIILVLSIDGITNEDRRILGIYAEHEFTYVVSKISSMIIREKDEPNWIFLRAELYMDRGMYHEAIEDYNTLEKQASSSDVSVYYLRGECYSEIGQYDKAVKDFEQAIELNGQEGSALSALYTELADCKRLGGDYKGAIEVFSKAIEQNPMGDYAYYKRGWTKEFIRDFQGALKDYNTAIDLDNEYAYTYLNRGCLYQKELDKPDLAKKDFLKVLELETEYRSSGNCRQYALVHLGREKDAIAWQDSILAQYPTSGNYYDAACVYSLMKRTPEAIACLRTAFEKGYREFIHLANDNDLDNIRNTPEYVKLMNEWKDKAYVSEPLSETPVRAGEDRTGQKYVVKMKELRSGVYEIPCTVNSLPLKFIFDTGASTVTLSSVEAAFMLKNDYLTKYDFGNSRNYQTASGDIVEGTKVRLRKIKIGELELNNIEASVVHSQNAPLLFGQSALNKLGKVSIDNKNNELTFEF